LRKNISRYISNIAIAIRTGEDYNAEFHKVKVVEGEEGEEGEEGGNGGQGDKEKYILNSLLATRYSLLITPNS
jgi:hypothetical protein